MAAEGARPAPGSPPSGGGLVLGRVFLLALAHGLLWAALLPPWQAPDEPKHFEYVRLLAEHPEPIAFADSAVPPDPELQRWIIGSMDQHRFWWYGHAPGYDPDQPATRFQELWLRGMHTATYRSSPAYYALAAALQPRDRLAGLYGARLLGVLMGALGVFFIGWAARELFPREPMVRYGAPILAALQPMAGFLWAGVNNDGLANLLAAFAFLLLARALSRGASPARLILLLLTVAAAVLTKRTTAYLIPMLALAAVAVPAARSRRPWLGLATGLGLLSAAGLAIAAWLREPTALPPGLAALLNRYFFNEPDQLERILRHLQAEGAGGILAEYAWGMLRGFWGSFGWQLIQLPAGLYAALGLLTAVALAGAVKRIAAPGDSPTQRAALLTALGAVILVMGGAVAFFAAYLDQAFAPPPQGRYLYAAWGPISLLLAAGWSAWLPPRVRAIAPRLLLGTLLAFDAFCFLALIIPYYYR